MTLKTAAKTVEDIFLFYLLIFRFRLQLLPVWKKVMAGTTNSIVAVTDGHCRHGQDLNAARERLSSDAKSTNQVENQQQLKTLTTGVDFSTAISQNPGHDQQTNRNKQ